MDLKVKEIQFGAKRFVIAADRAQHIHFIRETSDRLIRQYGATTARSISAELSHRRGLVVSPMEVESIASIDDGVHFSIADNTWLYSAKQIGEPFSRRVARILSIGKRLSPQELRQALRRSYREGANTPPTAVLTEVITHDPSIAYTDGQFSLVHDASIESFGDTSDEVTIVRLLLAKNGIAERRALQKEAERQGVSPPSFWRCLSYSTLIARYASGVYGLVGTRLPPGLVDEIQSAASVVAGGLIDRGWTSSGDIWLAYRLSDSSLDTGIVGIPAAMRDLLTGDFHLQLDGRGLVGQMHVQGSQAWGLRPALLAAGAEPGDCIIIRLNRKTREATVSVGDESLVDEFAYNS
jgi:hypothetical protein